MLVCRHPTQSTRNVRVKKIFDAHSWLFSFSHKYIILAMLTLESKVNFLLSSYLCCFDFSYSLSSAQVSLDFATPMEGLRCSIETQMKMKNFKCELSFKNLWKYNSTSHIKIACIKCLVLLMFYKSVWRDFL